MPNFRVIVGMLVLALTACSPEPPYPPWPTDDAATEDSPLACSAPMARCGSNCVDLQRDAFNCGACGRACESNAACVMGGCRVSCADGQDACTGACVDLRSNALNCGACGRACDSGQSCQGGACVTGCPSPRALCNGACIDLQSDAMNCAACGHACSAGQSCLNAACTSACPSGMLSCAGRCVDPLSDGQNCGACGIVCSAGQRCVAGSCSFVGTPDAGTDAGGPGACLPTNLGTSVRSSIATGTTVGRPGSHTPPAGCTGSDTTPSPDALFAWTAPSTGTFTFDTVGSGFDTVLTLRSGSCSDVSLGCNDDIINGTDQRSRLIVTLFAGQTVLIAIDGFGGATGSFVLNISSGGGSDAGTPDTGALDPCRGATVDGRCASSSVVEYCSVPTEGTGLPVLRRYTCNSDERCVLSIDGIATCQLAVACRNNDVQCVGTTQIRTCVAGSWRTQSCPRECISSPAGDFCAADVPVRPVTGRVTYDARGLNNMTAPSDWSTTTFSAGAQGFLILSLRINADGTYALFDATITTEGTADGGRFSIRVPSSATSSDRLLVMALAGDGHGGVKYVVANPHFAATGRQEVDAPPPDPQSWGWSWSTNSFISGATLNITESMGSGAARVFDYLRYVYGAARTQFGRDGLKLVAWLQYGTSWRCGACMWQSPITLFGTATTPGEPFQVQGFFDGSSAQGYWSDAVTAHEFGHWTMDSYSSAPTETGLHRLGGHVHPGMAWSEGFATWFSSDVRSSTLYYDKQASGFFWFDIGARRYGLGGPSRAWTRPRATDSLEQLIDENEVAGMMWTLRGTGGANSPAMYRALAAGRMQGPTFARGYRAWNWMLLDSFGDPADDVHTGGAAPYFADYLDSLLCAGFSRSVVDAATQPTIYYPYPSASPRCF